MSTKVTAIVPSKRVKDRYYLELDGGAEKLTVTLNQIADYSLFTGKELSDEELAALREDALRATARKTALRILGERNLSARAITEKLICKGVPEETAQETASWLEEIGAVNDAEYAAMIVRHYSEKHYGITRIKDELFHRGIPRELWDDALSNIEGGDDSAFKFLKIKLGGRMPDRAELKKATDALFRRGFTWDEIRSAAQRYKDENGDG